jgi:NAD(P)H-hydrate epimerase
MVVQGAQRPGCGIAFLATAESSAPAVDLALTEALVYGVAEDEEGYMVSGALEQILGHAERASALVVGPGWGRGMRARPRRWHPARGRGPRAPRRRRRHERGRAEALSRRDAPTVVTPHAGELGRLLGSGAKEVSARRLRSARLAAEEHRLLRLAQGVGHAGRGGEEGQPSTRRGTSRSPRRGRGTCSPG